MHRCSKLLVDETTFNENSNNKKHDVTQTFPPFSTITGASLFPNSIVIAETAETTAPLTWQAIPTEETKGNKTIHSEFYSLNGFDKSAPNCLGKWSGQSMQGGSFEWSHADFIHSEVRTTCIRWKMVRTTCIRWIMVRTTCTRWIMACKSTTGDAEKFPLNSNSIVFYPQTQTFTVKVLLKRFRLNGQPQQRINPQNQKWQCRNFMFVSKSVGEIGNQTLRENT